MVCRGAGSDCAPPAPMTNAECARQRSAGPRYICLSRCPPAIPSLSSPLPQSTAVMPGVTVVSGGWECVPRLPAPACVGAAAIQPLYRVFGCSPNALCAPEPCHPSSPAPPTGDRRYHRRGRAEGCCWRQPPAGQPAQQGECARAAVTAAGVCRTWSSRARGSRGFGYAQRVCRRAKGEIQRGGERVGTR